MSSGSSNDYNYSPSSHSTSISKTKIKTKRTRKYTSCENCIEKKIKCDKNKYCAPCLMRGNICVWKRGIPKDPVSDRDELEAAKAEIRELKSRILELEARLVHRQQPSHIEQQSHHHNHNRNDSNSTLFGGEEERKPHFLTLQAFEDSQVQEQESQYHQFEIQSLNHTFPATSNTFSHHVSSHHDLSHHQHHSMEMNKSPSSTPATFLEFQQQQQAVVHHMSGVEEGSYGVISPIPLSSSPLPLFSDESLHLERPQPQSLQEPVSQYEKPATIAPSLTTTPYPSPSNPQLGSTFFDVVNPSATSRQHHQSEEITINRHYHSNHQERLQPHYPPIHSNRMHHSSSSSASSGFIFPPSPISPNQSSFFKSDNPSGISSYSSGEEVIDSNNSIREGKFLFKPLYRKKEGGGRSL